MPNRIKNDIKSTNATLFVSDLSDKVTVGDLQSHFGVYGHVNNVEIEEMPYGKIAFINMKNLSDAQAAKDGLNRKKVSGRKIKVAFSKRTLTSSKNNEKKFIRSSCTLFLSGLHENVTNNDLIELFSTYGTVDKVSIQNMPYGLIGFLRMSSTKEAEAAVKGLNKYILYNQPIRVSFSKKDFITTNDKYKHNNRNNNNISIINNNKSNNDLNHLDHKKRIIIIIII